MTSIKPYLIEAYRNWILDNGMVPHILVDAMVDHIKIPTQYVNDGKIVLNISQSAALNFQISNGIMRFSARFGSGPMQVIIPTFAVMAICPRETGEWVFFEPEEEPTDFNPTPEDPSPAPQKPSFLKLVK